MNDAYAAGLVDGEGSISITKKLNPRVDIGMTDRARETLDALVREYGGSVRLFRRATEQWAEAWTFTVTSAGAAAMLERLLPWLRIKAPQAELAIRCQRLRVEMPLNRFNRPGWTPELRQRAEDMRKLLMELNAKGPRVPHDPALGHPFARLVGGRWLTDQQSLFSDLGYEPFSGPWPRSGFTRNGCAYARRTSERHIFGIDSFSLLPTPHGIAKDGQARKAGPTGNELGRAITLLPTPRERDHKGAGFADQLPNVVQLLTTLTDVACEWSGESTSPLSDGGKRSTGLRLSPWFVEWMMGLPAGWTDPDVVLTAADFRRLEMESRCRSGDLSENTSLSLREAHDDR